MAKDLKYVAIAPEAFEDVPCEIVFADGLSITSRFDSPERQHAMKVLLYFPSRIEIYTEGDMLGLKVTWPVTSEGEAVTKGIGLNRDGKNTLDHDIMLILDKMAATIPIFDSPIIKRAFSLTLDRAPKEIGQ